MMRDSRKSAKREKKEGCWRGVRDIISRACSENEEVFGKIGQRFPGEGRIGCQNLLPVAEEGGFDYREVSSRQY